MAPTLRLRSLTLALGRNTDHRTVVFNVLFWILDRVPSWLRPAVVGALAVLALTAVRVIVALPAFVRRRHVERDTLWLAVAAPLLGAAAGLAYSLVGKPLSRVPGFGPYLGGVVTMGAYFGAMAVFVVASGEKTDDGFWAALGLCTLIFGPIFGHHFLRDEPVPPAA
jgi:hypothetical protein